MLAGKLTAVLVLISLVLPALALASGPFGPLPGPPPGPPIPIVNPNGGGGGGGGSGKIGSGIGGTVPNQCGATDGFCNVVNFGADITGVVDSSPAFNAASVAACAAGGTIYIPSGTFTLYTKPWIEFCTTGKVPDIVGEGQTASVITNSVGVAGARGGSTGLYLAAGTILSSVGGAADLVVSGLVGGGNAFNWSTGNLNGGFVLNDAIQNRRLNGNSQFDVRVVFNTTNVTTLQYLSASDGAATPVTEGCNLVGPNSSWTCMGAYFLAIGSDGKLYAGLNTSVTGWTGPSSLASSGALSANTTYEAELSYDGAHIRLFHGTVGGGAMTEDAKVAATGTIVQRVDEDMTLGFQSPYWHITAPAQPWKGTIDTFEVSSIARCATDTCNSTNAKFAGDSNAIFLENWSNISLPFVGPEYTRGVAGDPTYDSSGGHQTWIGMHNFGLGNPGGNFPVLRDFSINSGVTGIQANVVAPQMTGVSGASSQYGLMLDQTNDYLARVTGGIWSASVLAIDTSGLTNIVGTQAVGAIGEIETGGPLLSGAYLLPSSTTQWDVISPGWIHIDSCSIDAENGGTSNALALSNMAQSAGPWAEVTNSVLVSEGSTAPVLIDGQYVYLNIKDSNLAHTSPATGVMVDASHGQLSLNSGAIVFDNDIFDNFPEPASASDTYVSLHDKANIVIPWAVTSGGPDWQTKVTGTSAGTAVWAEDVETSSRKHFMINLIGYENTTGTAQTVTYPVPFSTVANMVTEGSSCSGVSTTTSTLTLPSSMGSTQSGQCAVVGY